MPPDEQGERVKTAAQAQQNYVASAGRAQTAYVAGIQGTTKDQAALAVAAEARLVQNFNQAVSSGRWRQGVTAGGTAYWKAQAERKAPNYGLGFAAGEQNYSAAIQKVMNAIQTGVSGLPPRGDINANIQRSAALAQYLHSLKGQLGAR